MLHRINDVIELSSIEAHEKRLTLEPVNAAFLVEESIEAVKPCASDKGVKLTLSRGSSTQMMTTSVAATHEILVRLLDNAVKFSHPGGKVEVFLEQRNGVNIRICDYGIGIDPKVIQTLGKPFAQVEGHLQRSHGGLGLGLAISFGLADALNASISIESNVGHGTMVTLHIPEPPAGSLEFRTAA